MRRFESSKGSALVLTVAMATWGCGSGADAGSKRGSTTPSGAAGNESGGQLNGAGGTSAPAQTSGTAGLPSSGGVPGVGTAGSTALSAFTWPGP